MLPIFILVKFFGDSVLGVIKTLLFCLVVFVVAVELGFVDIAAVESLLIEYSLDSLL